MLPESRAGRIRVRQETERELDRITGWYFHDRILDDGLRDALVYASCLLNYSREYEIKALYDRWLRVIEAATRPEGRSLDELRAEILKDSVFFLADKENPRFKIYGTTLQNLANSIPAQ